MVHGVGSIPQMSLRPRVSQYKVDEVPALKCNRTSELSGVVTLGGSKNVGLKLLTTIPMFSQPVTLKNVPRNNQIRYLLGLLSDLGVAVTVDTEGPDGFQLTLHASTIRRQQFRYEEIRHCRHMFLLAMSVLLRTGAVVVPVPGYSHYGPRPITGQLSGLERMGAKVFPIEDGMVRVELPPGGLRGSEVFLPFPSNAVTEALVWAAVAASGVTTIHGAAQEPETAEICRYFERSGVRIDGIGTTTLRITGQGLACLAPPRHGISIMRDRIEAATFGAALTACGGEIRLDGVDDIHMASVRATLSSLGTEVQSADGAWVLRAKGRPARTDITTGPHPGFPTDGLGPYLTVLSIAQGASVIREQMWFNRLSLAMELRRMGAEIDLPSAQTAIIRGVEQLRGAPVIGTDPRATAALIIAGIAARGETTVIGVDLLDNAYDGFDDKLRALGAHVELVALPASVYSPSHSEYGRLEAF